MNFIISIFAWPLGLVMAFLYNITKSYGIAIIIFTIFVRLLMIPLSIKQQKSTAKMASVRPRIEEIQKKYAGNKTKMNEEMMKLYEEEGYSPTSGCLPMLIQMPILFGLIDVIYKPMTHIGRMSGEMVAKAAETATQILGEISKRTPEIDIINAVHTKPEAFDFLGKEMLTKIQNFDLNFLGLNLGEVPRLALTAAILIPIISGLTSFFMSYMTMKSMDMGDGEKGPAAGMQKTMMYSMPLMSLWFTFQVPIGVGLYWIISNILGAVQYKVINKVYNPKEMAAKAKAESEERRKREKEERKKAKELVKKGNKEMASKAMTKKEINRQRLNEARRRDALKYGEEYTEVTDEDLK